jgi:cytochrome c biogenesis protein ResB
MAEETPAQGASRLEPLSILWRILAAPQILLVCLGLLALALVLGALIPQIPLQARNDPLAWLAVQSGPFAPSIDPIRALHLYDLYHTLGFRLLLALTGLVLFVRATDATELAWRAARPAPWPSETFSFWGANAEQACAASPLAPETALPHIHEFLARHGFRPAKAGDLPLPNLVASRRPWALWAEPLVYVALLLALIGLVIGSTWGWQTADWQLAPGEARAVGHETGYNLRLPQPDHLAGGQHTAGPGAGQHRPASHTARTGRAPGGHRAPRHPARRG